MDDPCVCVKRHVYFVRSDPVGENARHMSEIRHLSLSILYLCFHYSRLQQMDLIHFDCFKLSTVIVSQMLVSQMLSCSIDILDIAKHGVPFCLVWNESSNDPGFDVAGMNLNQLSCLGMFFLFELVCSSIINKMLNLAS